jgi:hypothetical protein
MEMLRPFIMLIIVLCAPDVHAFGRTQSVRVTGKLFCGNESAAGIRVKLEDYDRGEVELAKM